MPFAHGIIAVGKSSNHDVDALLPPLHAQAELLFEESRFHLSSQRGRRRSAAKRWNGLSLSKIIQLA